ncbi:MAG: NADP-dependent malic enzyme, partial [Clostridia bacterium]|nr:NADP-dependent malic enzyme [Clostridia bacterium]
MKDSLALQKHFEWRGKVETKVKVPVSTKEELMLCYTPGVADACMAIHEQPELSFELTGRANTVAVITDGTAILGLGNIGPEAGMPVMEGKCALFKHFGGVDAFPICLRTTDPDE